MKKIYCVEKWWLEDKELYNKYNNNCEFWNCIEEPWKIGRWSFVEEYDDEETFKNDLLNLLNRDCVISKVYIKYVPDDYKPAIRL